MSGTHRGHETDQIRDRPVGAAPRPAAGGGEGIRGGGAHGGNSLSAIRVVAALRSSLGVPVTLRDLFEAPTVVTLEQALD
ncbi:phosphopantetheine-binding protein, partial [Nocardia wallacei]|uniref:phosphopantetheine-binding protein n=1 Tax=Nocardia wallacei TaxID=480035 RepID=UPI003CC7E58B